jgi:hypothetical protein
MFALENLDVNGIPTKGGMEEKKKTIKHLILPFHPLSLPSPPPTCTQEKR